MPAGPDAPGPDQQTSWYAAIQVSANLDTGAGASDVSTSLNGTWSKIAHGLGINDGDQKYSFVVTPVIAGQTLPALSPFEIDNNTTGGMQTAGSQSITLSISKGLESPWVPIPDGKAIEIDVDGVGSTDSTITTATDASKILSSSLVGAAMATPVAVLSAIAGPIQDAIQTAAGRNDTTHSSLGSIYPYSSVPDKYTYFLNDVKSGQHVAEITVQIVFRRTLLRDPPLANDTKLPDLSQDELNDGSFPTAGKGGTSSTVAEALNSTDEKSLVDALGKLDEATLPSTCSEFGDFLSGQGLNTTDTAFYMIDTMGENINKSGLGEAFWTSCGVNPGLARNVGLYDKILTTYPLNAKNSEEIGYYMMKSQGEGADGDVAGMLAKSVTWIQAGNPDGDPTSYDRDDTMAHLLALAPKLFYCNDTAKSSSLLSPAQEITMFLRYDPQPDQVLDLTSPGEELPVKTITVHAPTAQEFSDCTQYLAKMRISDPQNAGNYPPPISGPAPTP